MAWGKVIPITLPASWPSRSKKEQKGRLKEAEGYYVQRSGQESSGDAWRWTPLHMLEAWINSLAFALVKAIC